MSGVRHITVKADDDNQRMDRWLKKQCEGVPFGLLQKLMRQGQIRVDSKRVKPDTRLKEGQIVRMPPMEDKDQKERRISKEDAAYIKSLVIYDDGDVLAIHKPSGLATQGGTGIKQHVDGLMDGLINHLGVRPRLVHRLDKDTSGVLLLARSAEMARRLGKTFKGRDIQKIYWALVSPAPEMNNGEIRAPLLKSGIGDREKIVIDIEEGLPATTLFDVMDRAHKQAAFIAFWPRTGRTHQIRAHAEHLGCPIVGDHKYGTREYDHEHEYMDLEGVDIAQRLHLHAYSLTFRHPRTNKVITIQADLPKDLQKSWQVLGFDPHTKTTPFNDIKFEYR